MITKQKVILQSNKYDCGYACLAMLFGYKDQYISPAQFNDNEIVGRDGVSLIELKNISSKFHARLKVYRIENNNVAVFWESRTEKKPYLVFWDNNHYVILEKVERQKLVTIIDPSVGRIRMEMNEFLCHYSGVMACLEKNKINKEVFNLDKNSNFGKMIKWLKPYTKTIVAVLITSILFQSVNLIFPILMQNIIDHTNLIRNIPIYLMIISLISVGLLYFFLHITRVKLITDIEYKMSKNMTYTFIEKIFHLPLNFFENNTVGDIASRVNNITSIRDILSNIAVSVILDISVIVIYIFVMFQYSVLLSIIVIGAALLEILILAIMVPRISEYTNKELLAQAKFQNSFYEILRSINYVKTVGDTDKIKKKVQNEFENQIINFKRRMNISAVMGGASSSINLILPLLSIFVCFTLDEYINLSLGGVVAFSTIALRFLTPVGSLISSYESLQIIDEMFGRMSSVLEAKEEQDTSDSIPLTQFDGSIELKNVSFSYGKNKVLENFDLIISNKDKILIKGKSGEGKTTLFKILSGLYNQSEGKRLICQKDYKYYTMQSLRKRIGYIIQETGLFNGTIRENISFFQDKSNEEIVRAAKIACIHEDIMKLPMQYDTVLGDNGMALSGGQRQRIAIARTLVTNPDILLIDEGTSNLDIQTEKDVIGNIMRLDKTVLFISHRHSRIEGTNKTFYLKGSKLVLASEGMV